MERNELTGAKRVVIKLGTNIITNEEGAINESLLSKIVADIVALKRDGKRVILVTSGAIHIGLTKLHQIAVARNGEASLRRKIAVNANNFATRQAAASIGQSSLMQFYERVFREHSEVVAQILLTQEDLFEKERYLHVMNTLSALFNKYKAIPIVNENDTTSIEGIRLGENDKLAALVATKVDADLLILLSDIDGFFTADPRKNKNAQLIEVVHEISPEIEIFATGPASSAGTGGMRTKLNAAKIAIDAGIYMVIANGTIEHIIPKILNGERVGTLFIPKAEKMSHHKMWITHVLSPQGQIVVTEGARKAIQQDNASLLPIGIESLMGNFFFGDVVSLLDYGGEEFARGLVNYSAAELHRIQGKTSEEISKELGYQYNEVIHRNNLVILRNDS